MVLRTLGQFIQQGGEMNDKKSEVVGPYTLVAMFHKGGLLAPTEN